MVMPSGPESLALILSRFPKDTRWLMSEYFGKYLFRVRITRPLKLRLGSFRAARKGEMPVISLNNDLGPYTFLLVFLHEIAHLVVWQQVGRKARPHGKEWKNAFRNLVDPLFEKELLPEALKQSLIIYFRRTPASFQRDIHMQRILHLLDGKGQLLTLGDIPENDTFQLSDGKQFVKLERVRTRYKCYCPANKRYYLVSPAAQIFVSGNGD